MSTDDQNYDINPSKRAERLSAFTYADFISIIGRTGSDRPCEACGGKEWITPGGENGKPAMVKMPIFDSEETVVQLYVPRLCVRCANTRFYNVGWLLDGIPKAGASDER